jgi:hypothetical protein
MFACGSQKLSLFFICLYHVNVANVLGATAQKFLLLCMNHDREDSALPPSSSKRRIQETRTLQKTSKKSLLPPIFRRAARSAAAWACPLLPRFAAAL